MMLIQIVTAIDPDTNKGCKSLFAPTAKITFQGVMDDIEGSI